MNPTHPIWLILASFALALMPLLLGVVTSYVKVSIVLSMLKSGLGTQGMTGGIVVMSLSLSLSLYIMGPTWEASLRAGGAIPVAEVLSSPSIESLRKFAPVLEPWRDFMSAHAGKRELSAVESFEGRANGANTHGQQSDQIPWRRVMLAFVLTELRQAFSMGFVLLLPFLVIDLIVANILVGLGMFMVTPSMISLPLKLILFVVADGWVLLSRGLINSY